MREFRQNVIVSHGGKHGTSSRTLRKGTAPTRKDLEQIPDSVLGAVTNLGVDAPAEDAATAARVKARDAKLAQDPGEKLKAAVREDEKAKPKNKPKPKPKAKDKPKPKAQTKKEKLEEASRMEDPAPPAPPPPAEPPAPEVTVPTTKRELFLLRKTDSLALLSQLGVEHADDISGKAAKELLASTLGLE